MNKNVLRFLGKGNYDCLVFVMMGQSNDVGVTDGDPTGVYLDPIPNSFICGWTSTPSTGVTENTTFTPLELSTCLGRPFGVELSLAYAWTQANPTKKIFIVKVGEGGQAFSGNWGVGQSLPALLETYVDYAKTYLEAEGFKKPRWVWHADVWESDSFSGTYSDEWNLNMETCYNNLNTAVPNIDWHTHTVMKGRQVLPSNFYSQYPTNVNTIVTRQNEWLATKPRPHLISGDDLDMYSPFSHYEAQANIVRGNRLYQAIR